VISSTLFSFFWWLVPIPGANGTAGLSIPGLPAWMLLLSWYAAILLGAWVGTTVGRRVPRSPRLVDQRDRGIMGYLLYLFELPPFLVTLAGLFCLRGLGFVIHGESIGISHPFYMNILPQLSVLIAPKAVLPFTAICFLIAVAIGTLIAGFTRFGRNVYAIGSNEISARLMGLPVGATKITTYALAGFFSAFGGIVCTFYMQSGNPASFVGLELDAIAAVVIGGTQLTGGVGFVPGTLMGILILGLIQTLINFNGTLTSWWTRIVIGALLLIFIVLQKLISTKATRQF
jgi:simple sugar transport system permease protein